jgi:hypothetical protein
MRSRSATFSFVRLIGAASLGTYLGAAVAGLVAVVTGETFAAGSPWLTALPVLAVAGIGVGAVTSWLTRRWFVPHASRRRSSFVAAGVITLPLVVAIGQLREIQAIGVPLVVIGAVTTLVVYCRALRTAQPQAQHSYSRPVAR